MSPSNLHFFLDGQNYPRGFILLTPRLSDSSMVSRVYAVAFQIQHPLVNLRIYLDATEQCMETIFYARVQFAPHFYESCCSHDCC